MKLACSHIKKKNTDIFTTWVNQVLTSTSASRPSSTEGPAPGAISIPVSIPVSVTVSDTVFAPAPASATTTTVTAAAASSAIVAFTVRVPSRRVAIIIPLPGAIVSLTVISSPENFFFFKNNEWNEWKKNTCWHGFCFVFSKWEQANAHTCCLCCSENLIVGGCDSRVAKISCLVRLHDLPEQEKKGAYLNWLLILFSKCAFNWC